MATGDSKDKTQAGQPPNIEEAIQAWQQLESARAELDVASNSLAKARTDCTQAEAHKKHRQLVYDRIRELVKAGALKESLSDEEKLNYDLACIARESAELAIRIAEAKRANTVVAFVGAEAVLKTIKDKMDQKDRKILDSLQKRLDELNKSKGGKG